MGGDDDPSCGRCEEPIPADVTECPVCGYRPAGHNPTATRLGAYAFGAACACSLLVFVAGVTGVAPDSVATVAIVTPYTAGISGFFAYYLHRKCDATPVDDDVLG
jgi:hypothetical protein